MIEQEKEPGPRAQRALSVRNIHLAFHSYIGAYALPTSLVRKKALYMRVWQTSLSPRVLNKRSSSNIRSVLKIGRTRDESRQSAVQISRAKAI